MHIACSDHFDVLNFIFRLTILICFKTSEEFFETKKSPKLRQRFKIFKYHVFNVGRRKTEEIMSPLQRRHKGSSANHNAQKCVTVVLMAKALQYMNRSELMHFAA